MTHQRIIRVIDRQRAIVECAHCHIQQTVPRDEDGTAELEQQPCHDDDCQVKLCGACPQFECDVCGLAHCIEHRVRVSDLTLCGVCMADLMAMAVIDALESEE